MYFVSLYFHCHFERASYCHFEQAKRVEKSKSRKYNNYPEPCPRKGMILWIELSFSRSCPRKRPFLWTEPSSRKHNKQKPTPSVNEEWAQGFRDYTKHLKAVSSSTSSELCQDFQQNWNSPKCVKNRLILIFT